LGFVRARSLPQLTEILKAMGAWGTLRGRRAVVVTVSGAARTLFADAAVEVGLEFPPPSAAMAKSLRPQLPEFAHVSNPLDFNAAYTGLTGLTLENEPALLECFRTVLSDGYDVAVLHSDWTEFGPQGSPTFRAWIKATREAGTPAALVSMMPENMSAQAQDICRANGLACLQGLEDAVAAIAAVATHGERCATHTSASAMALAGPVAVGKNPRMMDEWESKTRLAAAGIAFPPARCVAADAVVDAAHEIGFPVVLKAVSAALPHKHQAGAVALNLADAADVRTALDRIATTLTQAGITPDAYLIERMVTGSVAELIVGIKASAIYGQALVIGAGGIDTERLQDVQTLLLPASHAELLGALGRLRVGAALAPAARPAVVALAQDIAQYAQDQREHVLALDLNPVIVTQDGQVIAVDALLQWQDVS
ncbi:MAG: acetate--CoA ligase family protein, partial [Betaproteobacteria bacterium]